MSDVVKFSHSKYWYARFMIDGKLYQKTTRSTNKRAAEQFAAKYRQEVFEDIHTISEKSITIRDCLELYKSSKPTEKNFQIGIAFISRWLDENIISIDEKITTLTSVHLEEILTARVAEGRKPSTNKIFIDNIIRSVKLATKHGYAVPTLQAPEIKIKNGKLRFFTDQEELLILTQLDPKRNIRGLLTYDLDPNNQKRQDMQTNYDIFVLLFDTGCRVNECGSLSWNDIDLMKGEIHVFRTKVQNESILHMTIRVKEILQRRYREKTTMWVFPNREGTPKKTFASLRRSIKLAGCDDASIHTIRHTTASRLVQRGTPIHEVSYILGHSSISMTERYAHLSKSDVTRRAAETLEPMKSTSVFSMSTNSTPETYIKSYTDESTIISIITDNSPSILDTTEPKDNESITISYA